MSASAERALSSAFASAASRPSPAPAVLSAFDRLDRAGQVACIERSLGTAQGDRRWIADHHIVASANGDQALGSLPDAVDEGRVASSGCLARQRSLFGMREAKPKLAPRSAGGAGHSGPALPARRADHRSGARTASAKDASWSLAIRLSRLCDGLEAGRASIPAAAMRVASASSLLLGRVDPGLIAARQRFDPAGQGVQAAGELRLIDDACRPGRPAGR